MTGFLTAKSSRLDFAVNRNMILVTNWDRQQRWCKGMSVLGLNFSKFYGLAVAAAVVFGPVSGHAQSGSFAGYAGNWTGSGAITIADSGTERIRCKGVYTTDSAATALQQNIKCASDSYKFELTSDVVAAGGQVKGSWSEASRNVNGTVEGSIAGPDINALVTTNGYAATFNVRTTGNKQSISISSKGELRGVTIALTKAN